MEPNQELTSDEMPALREMVVLDSSVDKVFHRPWRSCLLRGDRQEGSRASSMDSAPTRSSWWDTNGELDLKMDLVGFSYTFFHRRCLTNYLVG